MDRVISQIVSAVCLGAVLLAVNGCGAGTDVAEWKEEVRLHDGRTVDVWRRAVAHASGFPNARRGGDIEFELRYEPLGVQWKGPGYVVPVSFELFDDVPHLVVALKSRRRCGPLKKRTDFAAQFLRFQNGDWTEVAQEEFPVGEALANLYRDYWGRTAQEDAKGYITWETKASQDSFNPDKPNSAEQFLRKIRTFCDADAA
jgi:hypothetical protein